MIFRAITMSLTMIAAFSQASGQVLVREYADSVVLHSGETDVVLHTVTGMVDYRLGGGTVLENTVAYVEDVREGYIYATTLGMHPYSTDRVHDTLGDGVRLNIKHMDTRRMEYLLQHITMYEGRRGLLIDVEAGPALETRNISPLAVLSSKGGRLYVPGSEPRILDEPFDNDEWMGVKERSWPDARGIGYDFSSVYDYNTMKGLVLGAVTHDVWKTGIAYGTGAEKGVADSFVIYGGAATADRDGTHDHMLHGTLRGNEVRSPQVFLAGGDIRESFEEYGRANASLNGALSWKGSAPFYWNSFGVEGVLGYTKIMMPAGVGKISDCIHSLANFNKYGSPFLSIDSYDQSIYTTELLASLGRYGRKQNQQMGFYFIPFAIWAWKSNLDQTHIPGTDYLLKDVILRDEAHRPIVYKDGDWGAFPMDPTHPAVRQTIISQLQKARAINARLIKIDFLTAGALETSVRWDTTVRTGMQAYQGGMKMLKHLIDSILGPDVFITEAISPMFPSQYAHTRFVSTDVYSHLRDDQPGFPAWGSTEASLATGSHLWWVQGTLWPYTNLDVVVMKKFQQNPDLQEQEVKVRIFAMMVMGSIFGDGSDLRDPVAMERARKYLNNAAVCAYFSHPRAFRPLQPADGEGKDQQMAFSLDGEQLLAMFNFSGKGIYRRRFGRPELGLKKGRYQLQDFMTGEVIGEMGADQQELSVDVPVKDAVMIKIISKE